MWETLSKSGTASHREVRRAQVLLMAAEGLASEWIARVVGVSPATVRSWRARFAGSRPSG
ncbi:helix-turn-helix domain-containing protein [Paenarthrobacter aromaticivorans]|uniref:Helix-turn-helix domain-containing protein n=1 Tax=Paenarthrobacter aromaticivorans TaxID=2849150 RepID=A0ABS6I840_9MICC|nr:helix-turn-helix domain-containing protein [Paenarthrobacter sp. MMS21-TAE1-1]